MNKPEKIKIKIKDIPYVYIDSDLMDGEIEEISKKILTIKSKLKEAYDLREKNIIKSYRKDLIPVFTPFKDYQYIYLKNSSNYDAYSEFSIEVWRDETDEEYEKRLEAIKKRSESAKLAAANRKLSQEKREKSLLETLKKKYE